MGLKIGIIGAGGFARFAIQAFIKLPGVNCVGVYDKDLKHAQSLAKKAGGKVFNNIREFYQSGEIDLVYIATPPYLHYEQSKAALLAGKHVLCEKPAALKSSEAKELIKIAKEKNLLYVVNLMQRYNPLYQKVRDIIDKKILGNFLHGFFENYASNETLHPGHWMWDNSMSGGIFIEHGVHFFDMFTGWLGRGEIIAAQKKRLPGYKEILYNRVQAVVGYRNGIVNLYHGFDQPSRLDRQELRLLFQRGDITLYEWVPTSINLKGIVNKKEMGELKSLFPGTKIDILETYRGDMRNCTANFTQFTVDYKINLNSGEDTDKGELYQYILSEMFKDQLQWIKDREHQRVITGDNAYESLRMAEEADKKSIKL